MKTPFFACILPCLLLTNISCRPRGDAATKSADDPAKVDDSIKASYVAIITAATPRTSTFPHCKGPFCSIDSIQLEVVEPKAVFTFKVDTNTQIDDADSDASDVKFVEAAIQNKTIYAFKTAAYNGPESPANVVDINTNIVTGTIGHFALDPTATTCKETQPFCKFSEIQIISSTDPKPLAVDLSAKTATALPPTFSVQEAFTAKTPLHWALSRKETGGTSHPVVLLIGLTAAIKP